MIYIYRFLINLVLLFSPLIILIRFLKIKRIQKVSRKIYFFFPKEKWKVNYMVSCCKCRRTFEHHFISKKIRKKKDLTDLITTSTLTLSKLFKFKFKKTIHQFFPIDTNFFSKRFLNHWNQISNIWSEIWPNMLINLKKINQKNFIKCKDIKKL